MIEPLNPRTLIIGNSGSGKSTLAEGLGALIHVPVAGVVEVDALEQRQEQEQPQKLRDLLPTPGAPSADVEVRTLEQLCDVWGEAERIGRVRPDFLDQVVRLSLIEDCRHRGAGSVRPPFGHN